MSQAAFLRDFDAMAFGAFAGAGLADAASYLPHDAAPGADPLPCTVLVDRNVVDFDAEAVGSVNLRRTRVTFQRAEVTPREGGKVTVDGETFTLVQREREDSSASAWWVQAGG